MFMFWIIFIVFCFKTAIEIIYHSDKISQNIERWQSDAWMLERRWYKYYGANVHMQEMDERLKRIESIAKSKSEGKDNGIQET